MSSADHRRGAPPDGMLEAIRSLPSYVQRSHMFLILAPACKHVDSGILCNHGTWRERGWCNVEIFCSTIAPSEQIRVLIRGANDVEFVPFWESRPVEELTISWKPKPVEEPTIS